MIKTLLLIGMILMINIKELVRKRTKKTKYGRLNRIKRDQNTN